MAAPLSDEDWADLVARKATGRLYGVITTGIVCRSGCAARTPQRKNVVMVADLKEAGQMGLRPCKRCKPDV